MSSTSTAPSASSSSSTAPSSTTNAIPNSTASSSSSSSAAAATTGSQLQQQQQQQKSTAPSLLFISQNNPQSTSSLSLRFSHIIAKCYSPVHLIQSYSTPPFSSLLYHCHTVTSHADLASVARNTRTNGMGVQGIVEYLGWVYDACVEMERFAEMAQSRLQQQHQGGSQINGNMLHSGALNDAMQNHHSSQHQNHDPMQVDNNDDDTNVDLFFKMEDNEDSPTNSPVKTSSSSNNNGGGVADHLDILAAPRSDNDKLQEVTKSIDLDEDLYLMRSSKRRSSSRNVPKEHLAEEQYKAWRSLIPDVLLLRLDSVSNHDQNSSGLWSCRVNHGTHSRGLHLGELGPTIRKYMDIIFVAPKSVHVLPELKMREFLGKQLNSLTVQPELELLIAYANQHQKVNVPLLQKLTQQMVVKSRAASNQQQQQQQQHHQQQQQQQKSASSAASSVPEQKQKQSQHAASNSNSSSHQQKGSVQHLQLPWHGTLKYGQFPFKAQVYCNQESNMSVDNWPQEIQFPGAKLPWPLFKESMRQLFTLYSKVNLCQWVCEAPAAHAPHMAKLFQKLASDDSLNAVQLGDQHFFLFTAKGLFSKYLNNRSGSVDLTKQQLISIIISRDQYAKLHQHRQQFLQQQQQQHQLNNR